MAATSTSLPPQSLWFRFPSSRYVNLDYIYKNSTTPPFLSVKSHIPPTSSKKKQNQHYLHLLRASPGEIPNELIEDSKFVPLNADDPLFGPPALLLLGFEVEETAKIQQLLKKLDGEFLKVIHCTDDMIALTVWDAMHTQQQNLEAMKIAKSLPRICILSGLSGEEMMMFIDAFPESGLPPAVFAALVPNSANKLLGEVIDEIMGDHEKMSAKQSG